MSAAAIKHVKNTRRSGLLLSDKLVLSAIAYLIEDGKLVCFRSRSDIALEAGVSIPTVKRSLKRLVDKRVIHRSGRALDSGCSAPNDIQIVGFAEVLEVKPGRSEVRDQDELLGDQEDPTCGVSLNPSAGSGRSPLYKEEQKRTEETEEKEDLRVADARDQPLELIPSGTSSPDPLEAFHSYNRTAEDIGLPVARSLPPGRRKSIGARFREHGHDSWSTVLANIRVSDFLQGKNDRGWRPNLDWIIKPENYAKILEGNYAPSSPSAKPDRADKVFVPSRWGPGKWMPKSAEAVQ